MSAAPGLDRLIDFQRVAGNDPQPSVKFGFKLCQSGNAPAIAFNGDNPCAGLEQCAGEAAGTGPYLVDGGSLKRSRNGGNTGEQLPVEDEILPQRLGRLQAVPSYDVAQRFGHEG